MDKFADLYKLFEGISSRVDKIAKELSRQAEDLTILPFINSAGFKSRASHG